MGHINGQNWPFWCIDMSKEAKWSKLTNLGPMGSQNLTNCQFWLACTKSTNFRKNREICGRGSADFSRGFQKREKTRFWNFWFIFYMRKAKNSLFFIFVRFYENRLFRKKCEFTLKIPQTLVQFVVLMGNFPFGRSLKPIIYNDL